MINNKNFDVKQAKRPITETTKVFEATKDAQYAHHPYLCRFNGRFIALFSNGVVHEDDAGQRAVLCYSDDFKTWTKPKALEVTGKKNSVDTACGLFVDGDTLYVYVGTYFYDKTHTQENGGRVFEDKGHEDTRLYVLTSKDGVHFSSPTDTGLKMVPNMTPKRMKNGEVVVCGNFLLPVNKNFSNNPNAWEICGLDTKQIVDDSESFYAVSEGLGIETVVCEADIFEKDDGTYISLFRSQKKGFFGLLYASTSKDLRSWSLPKKTAFSNDTSKFSVGRLKDGRFFYIGNALVGGGRNPLVLSLSADGENFTEHFVLGEDKPPIRYRGFAKGGTYGYPYAFEDDGFFYAIYSINKEDVGACRVKISELV